MTSMLETSPDYRPAAAQAGEAPSMTAPLPAILEELPARGAIGDEATTETPLLDVVIPVHNEERDLAPAVHALSERLRRLPFPTRITIADNASRDATWHIAGHLVAGLPGVRAIRLAEKGRGRALRAAWLTSPAGILAYTDVDLSTDLAALLPLVAPLVSGHSDVAIGTRLAHGARIVRGPRREVLSRGYNLLLRTTLRVGFSDAQCGFKAIRADVARALVPLVNDDEWFFDTELLVLAERHGLRIHEVPVDWRDDPDSRVDVSATVLADLRGIGRLARDLVRGGPRAVLPATVGSRREDPGPQLVQQLIRFAGIGVVSTLAYAALYLLLRPLAGPFAANGLALLLTAVGNTAANRRVTFGVRGSGGAAGDHVVGLIAFVTGLAITSGALGLLHAAAPGAGRAVELLVLVAASAAATVVRFVALRLRIARAPQP
jgi:putative flippase GtrA